MHSRRFMKTFALGAVCAGLIPATLASATAPPSSSGDADPYCAAHLALETATSNDDPADDGPAVEAAQAAAPEELQDALTTAIANAPTDGPSSPEFDEAYGTLVDYVRQNCGFAEIDVLAQDYSFGGLGGEVAAGPTIINLHNEGTEYHEIVMFRKNDGVTTPAEELMALPEEEVFGQITFVAFAMAAPGTTASGVADLAAGDYIAVCFIPEGSTPEAVAAMEAAAGSAPEGTMAEGTMAEGSMAAGTMAEGTMAEGTMAEGTMAEGTMAEGTMAEGTMAEGSMAAGSAPEGSAPAGEGPPHFTLGMIVEFTVVEGGTTDTGTAMEMDMAGTTEAATTDTAAEAAPVTTAAG